MEYEILEFGTLEAGADYVLRPGGYALVLDWEGNLAVVSTSAGTYLLGGGQERGESPEAAVLREVAEECGIRVSIVRRIGVADELVFASDERVYYRKRCTFFRASIVGTTAGYENGHVLSWVSPSAALQRLQHRSQRWAIEQALAQALGERSG